MPKVKWYERYKEDLKKPVKEDHLLNLINRYQKEHHIKRDTLAKLTGIGAETVSRKKQRGLENLTLKEFKAWGQVIHIPEEDMADAVFKYLIQEERK